MDMKVFLTVFITIFLAEIGDKSQIATMLYASDKEVGKWTVYFASATALLLCLGLALALGSSVSQYINEKYLRYTAGVGFIFVGLFTLLRA